MSGITRTAGNIVKRPTRALTAVGTFGMSEVARAAFNAKGQNEKLFRLGEKVYTAASLAAATAAVGGPSGLGLFGAGGGAGGGGAAGMASSGGMSMLSKVALGMSVASAVGAAFNKPAGMDYSQWKSEFSEADQAEIARLEATLNTVQNDINIRNQAVSKLIDDFPNVMQQTINAERAAVGKAYDQTTKMVLDNAANQLAAKYAATGGFSSGAFNQGLAKEATGLALERAGAELDVGRREAQIPIQQYQMRLAETEALRDFQRSMLGEGIGARNSAMQNLLQRKAGAASQEMQLKAGEASEKRQQRQQLFGSLGNLAGNLLMSQAIGGRSPFGGTQSDPNAGFAELRQTGQASRAPGGVQQYRPASIGGF
jgi:hypothetical protein